MSGDAIEFTCDCGEECNVESKCLHDYWRCKCGRAYRDIGGTNEDKPGPANQRDEFAESLRTFFAECKTISRAKNGDYAEADDPFKNFRMVEHAHVCSTEQGIVVRMFDKMSRISSLISREALVKDESIEDTLRDLANYAAILSTWLKWRKNND